ncbi:MAG: hypothetical protein LBT30_04910 [Clostridiales bacterium]|jgi:MoxR-like ATPase|nr:hypothetical protein [Clostridiales bacterium]
MAWIQGKTLGKNGKPRGEFTGEKASRYGKELREKKDFKGNSLNDNKKAYMRGYISAVADQSDYDNAVSARSATARGDKKAASGFLGFLAVRREKKADAINKRSVFLSKQLDDSSLSKVERATVAKQLEKLDKQFISLRGSAAKYNEIIAGKRDINGVLLADFNKASAASRPAVTKK